MSGPRVGSLFSGVEGIGQGLEAAGFEVAWQVEIDKDAVSVLERHYPNVRRYRDVRTVTGKAVRPLSDRETANGLSSTAVRTDGAPLLVQDLFQHMGTGEPGQEGHNGAAGSMEPCNPVWTDRSPVSGDGSPAIGTLRDLRGRDEIPTDRSLPQDGQGERTALPPLQLVAGGSGEPGLPQGGDCLSGSSQRLDPVDVICGGFPCQDLSVAGKQAGLAGARSGLFWEVVRIVREMREATEGRYPAVVILENVPGLLSSNGGRDFAAVLRGLGELGAAIAWRIFDAQFFGVPQRRRRVFIVADFAELDLGERRATEILSLFEGMCRHSQESLQTGQGAPGVSENGAGSGGIPAKTLTANSGRCQVGMNYVPTTTGTLGATDLTGNGAEDTFLVAGTLAPGSHPGGWDGHSAYNGHLIPMGIQGVDVANALNTHRVDDPSAETFIVAAPLTAGGHPDSNAPGRHREDDENLVAVAVSQNQRGEVRESDVAPALGLGGGKPGQGYPAVLAFDWQKGDGGTDDSFRGKSRSYITRAGDYAGALSSTKHDAVAIPISADAAGGRSGDAETPSPDAEGNIRLRPPSLGVGQPGDPSFTISATGAPAIGAGAAVRRLMPVECERLMGWTDGHTERRADGTLIPDGPRYRMIGNGVVAPVAAWIGRRLRQAMRVAPQPVRQDAGAGR